MTKRYKNVNTFKGAGYSSMFHEIASNAYDHTKTYCTGNGKVYCLSNDGIDISVFYFGIKIAHINKETEIVETLPMYSLGTTVYYILKSLTNAFDHFTARSITCFTSEEAQSIKDLHAGKEFPVNQVVVDSLGYITNTLDHLQVDSKELSNIFDVARKQKEKEEKAAEARRKAEEERLAKRKEEIEALTPFFTELYSKYEGNYNKLKEFRKMMRLKRKDIPDNLFKYFRDRSYSDNDVPEDKKEYEPIMTWTSQYEACLGVRMINRYGYRPKELSLPDGIALLGHTLLTTQGCEVDVCDHNFILLFKALMHRIKKQEDCSEFYGDSVGDYSLREVNYEEKFIRVGCHCFLFEDILELEEAIKNAYNLHQG